MDRLFKPLLVVAGIALAAACSRQKAPPAVQPRDAAVAKPERADAARPSGTVAAQPPGSHADGAPAAGKDPSDLGPPPYQTSNRALLQWKRKDALEADLMGALHLSREELCVEVGGKNCVRDVHLVPLGGNDPYESGLMKPSAEPLATTSSVVDRVLLSACSTRARLDTEKAALVFTALNLKGPLPPAADPAIASTIRDLYRRFLARDPVPHEVELVAALANDEGDGALSTQEFAALSCFTIGSSAEFLFF